MAGYSQTHVVPTDGLAFFVSSWIPWLRFEFEGTTSILQSFSA